MTAWRYGLASHPEFPDPLFEIDSLAALEEEGVDPYLLLARREHPPAVRAKIGDDLLLCVRRDARSSYTAVARARVVGPATQQEVPPGHEALYGGVDGERWWLPVSIEKFPGLRTEEELGLARNALQTRGQAGVWKLESGNQDGRTSRPSTRPAQATANSFPAELPRLLIQFPESVSALGVDLTAGDPASAFDQGKKPFWPVYIRARMGRLELDVPAQVATLTGLESAIRELCPGVVVIDGPSGANGIRLNPERNGWVVDNPGVRSAERELSRRGVKLFWTTAATLRSFSGAREWILRSLVLFERLNASAVNPRSASPLRALETHPHAFFVLLWRAFGNGDALSPKKCATGRKQRLALLRMFLDLEERWLPDDDAVDSAAAAVLGILVQADYAEPIGSEQTGGRIWVPDVEALPKIPRSQS